jgi:hypothetical protein
MVELLEKVIELRKIKIKVIKMIIRLSLKLGEVELELGMVAIVELVLGLE